MGAEIYMPNINIQRGPTAGGPPENFVNRNNANGIYVDAVTGALTVGTGTSGVSSKIVGTTLGSLIGSAAAATVAITAAQSGSTFLFDNAAGTIYTLPTPAVGLSYNFLTTVLQTSGADEVDVDS